MRIDGWGVILLIWTGAFIPWLAWRTSRRLGDRELPIGRPQFFWQTTFFQLFLFAMALVVAATNGIRLRLLPRHASAWWAAAALLLVLVAALKLRWRARTDVEKRKLDRILPHGRAELLPYFVLCVAAGVAEETLYRGTAYRLLLRLGLTMPVAVALLVVAFAAGHITQGLRSVFAIGLIAAAFHAVVIYSKALLPAIVAHTLYDAIAGVLIPKWISAAPPAAVAEAEPGR
jgi:hypothetical protein